MSEVVRARVEQRLTRLRLGSIATRLDAILSQAARKAPTYLDFLDEVLGDEIDTKQKQRVAMGIQIAHFPTVKPLEEFDFKFQPPTRWSRRGTRSSATRRSPPPSWIGSCTTATSCRAGRELSTQAEEARWPGRQERG